MSNANEQKNGSAGPGQTQNSFPSQESQLKQVQTAAPLTQQRNFSFEGQGSNNGNATPPQKKP